MGRTPNRWARDALIASARTLFAEKGLLEVRVEEITALAGTSKGAFYLHFKTKDEVFQHIVGEFLIQMRSALGCFEPVYGAEFDASTIACLEAGDMELARFMWENRDCVAMIFHGGNGAAYEGLLEQFLEGLASRTADNFRRLFETSRGLVTHISPEIVGQIVAGATYMFVRAHLRSAEKPDFDTLTTQFRDLLFFGLVCRAPASEHTP